MTIFKAYSKGIQNSRKKIHTFLTQFVDRKIAHVANDYYICKTFCNKIVFYS